MSASPTYAELKRRQGEGERPQCGSNDNQYDYDTGLHVFALFLILFVSFLSCAFPIIARRWPKLPIPHYFLFLSRHFGTGVLIATAFVHLLPTAFTSLHDPCLPPFWTTGYQPMPGLIAMVSVFVVVGIEMFFATRGAGHIHASAYDSLPLENGEHDHRLRPGGGGGGGVDNDTKELRGHRSLQNRRFSIGGLSDSEAEELTAGASPLNGADPDLTVSPRLSLSSLEDDEDEDDDGPAIISPSVPVLSGHGNHRPIGHRSRTNSYQPQHHHSVPSDPAKAQALEKKLLLQCLLLEAGILFHSVFIGIALSVSVGPPFAVLLIAITFHQTFEGLALGSRIAAIPTLSPSSPKPWLMAVAYAVTTPLGQAIGLGVHRLYDPRSQVGLLMVGTMNAVSSGLLLFAGLVELLAEDFLSDASYATLKGRRRKEACAAVVAGAGLMSLVGAWA